MTRPNGVEQSYSFGELASHNSGVEGRCRAWFVPGSGARAVLRNASTGQDQGDLPG
jgi:hypothetical protein